MGWGGATRQGLALWLGPALGESSFPNPGAGSTRWASADAAAAREHRTGAPAYRGLGGPQQVSAPGTRSPRPAGASGPTARPWRRDLRSPRCPQHRPGGLLGPQTEPLPPRLSPRPSPTIPAACPHAQSRDHEAAKLQFARKNTLSSAPSSRRAGSCGNPGRRRVTGSRSLRAGSGLGRTAQAPSPIVAPRGDRDPAPACAHSPSRCPASWQS